MLEQLRKSGASIFIYLIFGLLIVIFVINFAPNAGSGKGGGGCAGTGGVLTVGGSKVNDSAYHVAYAANKYSGRQKVYAALEMLVRRELLADAASEHGLHVTNAAVEAEMKKGYFFFAGFRIPDYTVNPQGGPQFVSEHSFFDDVDGEKYFNFGKFKGWVNSLNVSIGSYYDEQARAMQASLMQELLADSVRVSREEALTDYLFENNTVTYDAVTFSPASYKAAIRLTEADVTRFLTGHEAEVKKKYADEERTYKATKPKLKLRSIFIAKAEPAAPTPAPTDDKKPADGAKPADGTKPADGAKPADDKKPEAPKAGAAPAKPVGLPIEEAKAKLEAARTAITAGKLKFADAAKQLSTDELAKLNGGDLGWRLVENAQLGEQAANDAVKALKVGELTAVIVTDTGAFLVTAEDKREGDLSYDQVKAEIASELAKDVWSKEAAKRAALDALAAAHAGTGKNLGDLFQREANTEQEQQRMQRMIEQQMQQQQHGSITRESKDVPANWQAEEAPTTGGGSAAPAAGSAAPAAGSAAPAAGSAAPAAGSAAGSAAPAAGSPATTPAPVSPLEPSKDVLPAFGDAAKPKVMSQGPAPRGKQLPGLGDSKEAITALFDELTAGMLAKQVYETQDGYVLIQLTEKSAPKVEDFDKIADKEISALRAVRGRMAVESWLKARCEALAKDGKISPRAELVHETDEAGKPLPQVYRPCMSFR